MTRDPQEGVRRDGCVRTGVGAVPVGSPYDRVLALATDQLSAAAGTVLHSLYVYGSVATGQAQPPGSDVDLYAILHGPVEAACHDVAARLSEQFAEFVRDVGITTVLLDEVLAETLEGHAERCFIRHYCWNVAGHDLRPQLPDCEASARLARGFNGNVGEALDGVVDRLHDRPLDEAAARRVIAQGARKLLMAAATLLSARSGDWTTDRQLGARMLASTAPELAPVLDHAVTWSRLDVDSGAMPPVDEAISTFGVLRDWLVREYAATAPDGPGNHGEDVRVEVASLLDDVVAWARTQADVRAVGLVGSHARGTASAESDVDLVIVVDDVRARLDDDGWLNHFGIPRSVVDEDWGAVQSRRAHYRSGLEVEFGLTTADWVDVPLDVGTARVIRDGFQLLHDPDGLLDRAVQATGWQSGSGRAIRAVILDIGGVLEDTPETGWVQEWERRLHLEPGGLHARIEPFLASGELGTAAYEEIRDRVATVLGLAAAASEALWNDLWAEYLGTLNRRLLHHVSSLRPALKVGLLSNSFVGARQREEQAYGFSHHVDVIVYSHEEGLRKPDPRFYLLACQRLGVEPHQVVFVDDHQLCVTAACDLGMSGILFTNEEDTIAAIDAALHRDG